MIESAPEGAKARIINSRGGGYYDDVYVKTPKGWRFKSRNVVSDEELAAKLTTQDFIEIRRSPATTTATTRTSTASPTGRSAPLRRLPTIGRFVRQA